MRPNPTVYQLYPRSFQDSNGDGIGDLVGIASRLDYLSWLGVGAIWLSPVFQSPMRDGGYDVSDFMAIDPIFGTEDDFDALLMSAKSLEIAVLLDIVPCHTSIEHKWFRERPDFYIWHTGEGPPNNWKSIFGGSAWTRDGESERWYLHTFYDHQPQLNWRNPEVRQEMTRILRYWLDRGVDGFRMDALQVMFVDEQLRDEPPVVEPFAGPAHPDWVALQHTYTLDLPEVPIALKTLVQSLPPAFFVAEVYADLDEVKQYRDAVGNAFCFALASVPPNAQDIATVLRKFQSVAGLAWAMANHDISRLSSRWGEDRTRLAAVLLTTMPGSCFLYQGEEIGMEDGDGALSSSDALGRDVCRHPMQWTESGGFTDGSPWLSMTNPERLNVESQKNSAGSLLNLYRELIALRHHMDGDIENVECNGTVLTYIRGNYLIAINFGVEQRDLPALSAVVLSSSDVRDGVLAPLSGLVGRL